MPSRNPNHFSFGAGAVGFIDYATGREIGMVNLVSGFETSPTGDVVAVDGGPVQYSTSARGGRVGGEISLTFNECPNFLDDILRGVDGRPVDAIGRSSAGEREFRLGADASQASNVAFTDLDSADRGLSTSVTATIIVHEPAHGEAPGAGVTGHVKGTIFVTGETGGSASIKAHSNMGSEDLGSVADPDASGGILFRELGFRLTISGTISPGDHLSIDFTNSRGAGRQWAVGPYARNTSFHRLVITTGRGSDDDDLYEWVYNKVFISGGKDMARDGSSNQGDGIDISAKILLPDNGLPVYTFTKLPPVARG